MKQFKRLSTVLIFLIVCCMMMGMAALSAAAVDVTQPDAENQGSEGGDEIVDITDENLKNALLEQLGLVEGTDITKEMLLTLTDINFHDREIKDITPLQYCKNLENLGLLNNQVSDISALAGLTQLKSLELWDNYVTDVAPLAELTNLEYLGLGSSDEGHNAIQDISMLSKLTNLTNLDLPNSQITDFSVIENFTKLEILVLQFNHQLEDISFLKGLSCLKTLFLSETSVRDLTPLANLSSLKELYAHCCNIVCWMPVAHIEIVEGRPEGWTEENNWHDWSEPDAETYEHRCFCGASERPIDFTGNETLKERIFENLRRDGIVGENGWTVFETEIYPSEAVNLHIGVNISCAVEWDDEGNIIYLGDRITDISQLAYFKSLAALHANYNLITDISPIAEMTELWDGLNFIGNENISDISVISNLTKLKDIKLSGNSITDVSPLADLQQLESLWLADNPIENPDVLSGLTNLTWLEMQNTGLTNLDFMKDMNQLKRVFLFGNEIKDVSPLGNKTSIEKLHLGGNPIQCWQPVLDLGLPVQGGEIGLEGLPDREIDCHTVSAWSCYDGTYHYGNCVFCGAEVPQEHWLDESTDWQYNDEGHYRTCGYGCGYPYPTLEHTWDNGTVTTPATHLTEGEMTYACTICGKTRTEAIAKDPTHKYGEWEKCDEARHVKTCECGDKQYEEHTWDNGTVTAPATHLTEGEMTYACTVCGETRTEAIAKDPTHKYGEWEKFDETRHVKTCECGKEEFEPHKE